jgi:transcriptional regulator with XRE-family HTH domain
MFHSTAPVAQVFATNVKHRRQSRGLSIASLAERTGNPPEFIEAIEKAANPKLGCAQLEAVAAALGVTVSMLLRRDFAHSRDAPHPARFPEYIPAPRRLFSPDCIRRIESGDVGLLTLTDIAALAHALSMTEEQLCQQRP